MTVLVVTVSDDREAPKRVGARLEARGMDWVRLDSDRYPDWVSMSSRLDGALPTRTLSTPELTIDLGRISAVWFRRFHAGAALPPSLGELRAAAVEEARRTLLGHLTALDVPMLNHPAASARCDAKEVQLVRAHACGLDVPRTLITNDPVAARAFFTQCEGRVIAKAQSSWTVEKDGVAQVVFTSVVHEAALDDLMGLRLAPMTFQEHIEKSHDVRAIVIGDRVLVAELPARDGDDARPDWRRAGMARLAEWKRAHLPAEVERGLVTLAADLGLGFAAADLVRGRDGRAWFLEVNAGGEWVWIDDVPGLQVADAIAERLAALSSSLCDSQRPRQQP